MKDHKNPSSMAYLPAIDGFRAVAVLSVIIYHASASFLPGGYLGVDVFFVISGFLITGVILDELDSGRFSISGFFKRRIRRILPILLFVCLASVPFAWLLLPQMQLKDFFQSLVAISVYSSNFLFWIESGYFEVDSSLKPLIHTWTLGVEEQFYILLPIALIFLHRRFRQSIPLTLFSLMLVSLTFAHLSYVNSPDFTFFLLPTRAWELLAGSLTFWIVYRTRVLSKLSLGHVSNGIFAIGLLIIAISVVTFSEGTPIPSLWGVLPVAGTAMVLIAIAAHAKFARILLIRPLVWIGLVSYSAYLWHQPLFAFSRAAYISAPPPSIIFLLILGTFALSFLSWKFIERPFRDRSPSSILKDKHVFGFAAVFTISLGAVGLWGHFGDGHPQRIEYRENAELTLLRESTVHHPIRRERCQETKAHTSSSGLCLAIDHPNERLRVGVFGDSHATAILPAFEAVSRSTEADILFMRIGCSPISNVLMVPSEDGQNCGVSASSLPDLADFEDIDVVFLFSRWSRFISPVRGRTVFFNSFGSQTSFSYAESRKAFESGVEKTFQDYEDIGVPVVFVGQPPDLDVNAHLTIIKMGILRMHDVRERRRVIAATSPVLGSQEALNYSMRVISESASPCSAVVSLEDELSSNGRVLWSDGLVSFYRDDNHLSSPGALRVAPLLTNTLERLLSQGGCI